MREIKFRAWGKYSKEFLCYNEGGNVVYGLTLKNIQNIEDIEGWDFQQYTGLKDRNGKEIYEGDILNHRGIEQGKCEVAWSELKLCWMLRYEDGVDSEFPEVPTSRMTNMHSLEVIGNIYEK